jgi:uncharacterized DUF497 family protein
MRFDWNPSKAAANQKKHRVLFSEACTIFADQFILSIYDKTHSEEEDRWASTGMSEKGRIIVVVHTWEQNENEEYVRIISARSATSLEQRQYLERRRRQ